MHGASLLARQRSGIYIVRKRVPDDLKPVLGQTEIKRSLRTNRKSEATATKHQIAMALDHLFAQAMLRLPRTTLSAKYKGKTTPQIIEMADCEDKANRDRHGADAPLVARVASKTAERDVSAVAAVLNYGENDGYFGDGVFSPFRGITVDTSGSGR